MVYRWNVEGTSLEFPTPYTVENRFLKLRGCALIALALLLSLIIAFAGNTSAPLPVVMQEELAEPASAWPHVLVALLMATLGLLNLWQARRQNTLKIVPGQPASLMSEVPHEATGASPGAPWLMQALTRGVATAAVPASPYARLLRRLGNDLATAPSTLHACMRVRLAHLLLLASVALLWGVVAVVCTLLAKPVALALVSGVVLLLLASVAARHLLQPLQPALAPWAVAALVLVGCAVAAPLAWFAADLPGAGTWPRLALPAAAVALLGLSMLFELMALLAARRHIIAPRPARLVPEALTVSFDADPAALFNEIDRELHRRWAEGIPNRRYSRQPPVIDAGADEGPVAACVLEESQPLTSADTGASRSPVAPSVQTRWVWLLDALGLAVTVAGGLLLAWAARAQLQDSTAPWLPFSVGLVCVLVGGYALHIGHLLWSRVEVDSVITWLDFKGTFVRASGAISASAATASVGAAPPRTQGGMPLGIEELTVKAWVVLARSVFYAAGSHGIGSRTLVALVQDSKATAAWTALVQGFVRHTALAASEASPGLQEARARARERRVAEPGPVQKRTARFCAGCGTPLLVGARFCQHCGGSVAAD